MNRDTEKEHEIDLNEILEEDQKDSETECESTDWKCLTPSKMLSAHTR